MTDITSLPNWAVPGQQVACVFEGRWNEVTGHPDAPQVWPHRHFIYTIAEVVQTERGIFLTLVELGPYFEYHINAFEPVDPREVEAQLFNARRARQPAREPR